MIKEPPCGCIQVNNKEFWQRVVDAGSRRLVAAIIAAARHQVEYSRQTHASERAKIVLGPTAGQSHTLSADVQRGMRNSELRLVKQAFTDYVEGLDKDRRARFDEFFHGEGWKELLTHARDSFRVRLVETEGGVDDTRKAALQLEVTIKELNGLLSLERVGVYLRDPCRRLDQR